MKLEAISRRLAALEARAEPPKFQLLWYDEEQAPPEPGTVRIQLKWLDEVRPWICTIRGMRDGRGRSESERELSGLPNAINIIKFF
jgi:hypothetical protein